MLNPRSLKNAFNSSALAMMFVALGGATSIYAQRTPSAATQRPVETSTTAAPTTPAPVSVKVKYQGGVIGYPQKRDGTLSFDDINSRLVFRDKKTGTELFSIPYSAIVVAYADNQSRRPAGSVIAASAVPYGLGLPALLIKKKYRYLALQYRDDEARVFGTTSFKVDNKPLLESTLNAVGTKAKLTKRGEIFIRPRPNRDDGDTMIRSFPLPPPQ
ncbi:MAG: hypothetical protein MSG64_09485 [Pyrinomonadaceae bacterium MAG19_C2-C3]|nr:hypothetical protein [Pyrinomonadaceae bacterium MAG19_C2-C3]